MCSLRKIQIKHETATRLRLFEPLLTHPELDLAELQAYLEGMQGVRKVRISPPAASIIVEYNGSTDTRQNILNFMQSHSFSFTNQTKQSEKVDLYALGTRMGATLCYPFLSQNTKKYLSLALTLPYLTKGMTTLLSQGVKIEVLDAAAIGFSLLRRDYFTALSVTSLLSLGEYLEQSTESKSTELLKSLLRPVVSKVTVLRDDIELQIPIDKLEQGEQVVCGPGELIPVDGTILHGEALVNQSAITGESLPVHLQKNNDAVSGTVVEEGKLIIRADKIGEDASIARMSKYIRQSLERESQGQRQSQILANKLVPLTFALGLLIYALTRNPSRAASVLTVDYSCAIKIASSVAIKSAMRQAAIRGALLKGGQALENMHNVDALVMDKTGTLTTGKLKLEKIISTSSLTDDAILALAAGAEEHYSHPVAQAVVKAAKDKNLELPKTSQVDFVVAHGVSAYIDGRQTLVGSYHFIAEDEGVDCSATSKQSVELRAKGYNLLYISQEKKLLGVLALSDQIRPEAEQVLAKLRLAGIKKIVVLTGDHSGGAEFLKNNLPGPDEIHAELKPEQKAEILDKLKQDGFTTAFVGDGVNDAPAMVRADVGICMSGGADLARESAQVILLKDELTALWAAKDVADKTYTVLNKCFTGSVSINSLLLFLATGGIAPAAVSATLHNAATIGLVGYAASPQQYEEEKNI